MKGTLFFLLLSSFFGFSQADYTMKSVSIRGKIISSAVAEDVYFRNLSFGFEVRPLNNHSVGFDYIHFRWRNEYDSIIDNKEVTGPSVFSKRNYLNIDYRFYLIPKKAFYTGFDLYLNSFMKIGIREVWSDDSNLLYENLYTHKSNFRDFGLAIGSRFGSDRFGGDFNIGTVKRFSDVWYEKGKTYHTGQVYMPPTTYEKSNFEDTNWALHMRLNLYWNFILY